MSSKFAKKGHLVVDTEENKLHKVGDKDAKTTKFMKKAGIEEAPEGSVAPKKKTVKEVMADLKNKKTSEGDVKVKAEKPAKEKSEPKEKVSDNRKIKVLNKKFDAREGSKRHAWLTALVTSKTLAEAREKVEGLDSGVVKFAVSAGVIELV